MRCTINQIPCTPDLLTTSRMQLALLVQPLALPHPSEEPIQIVDFGEGGPVRCSRCKGYIDPFMKFVDQGNRFICNFCGFTDETPREYQCNLGPDGRRRDVDERPELCRGTVEFVATREFLFVLQQYGNPLSKKLNEVINEIRSQRCNYRHLKLCKKGDPSGMLFFSYMVEDKSPNLSYFEFLLHVH